ncbi:MAG: hypothetical protein AMXMBFR13_51310 [Phycisphaerae bacterium]
MSPSANLHPTGGEPTRPVPAQDNTSACTDPRVYFAAERTLLAWIRTGLAMMGFGFVVARFGLFLRELAGPHQQPPPTQGGLSIGFGTGLLVLGVLVNLLAAGQYMRQLRRLNRGKYLPPGKVCLATVVAGLLAALGIAMAVYLLSMS